MPLGASTGSLGLIVALWHNRIGDRQIASFTCGPVVTVV